MKCYVCGFEETENNKMVGLFVRGSDMQATNKRFIGLYGCPNCKTVQWTDDIEYIRERKTEYKSAWKSSRNRKDSDI